MHWSLSYQGTSNALKNQRVTFKMKKFFAFVAVAMLATTAFAQGTLKTYGNCCFKLHVYNSNDVMADASYIVETPNSLVTLEEPLFKTALTEFNHIVDSIGKPVADRIIDYHEGGNPVNATVRAEGMTKFMTTGAYDAMMQGFHKSFGDKIVDRAKGQTKEIAFGDTLKVDGVDYVFNHGSQSDFPAAAILIGGKYLLQHWAPGKAHMNALQLANRQAVDAELAASRKALQSGAEYLLGSHGGFATKEAMKFKVGYLETLKKLLAENSSSANFVEALKKAYPNLPGEQGLEALAANLYK